MLGARRARGRAPLTLCRAGPRAPCSPALVLFLTVAAEGGTGTCLAAALWGSRARGLRRRMPCRRPEPAPTPCSRSSSSLHVLLTRRWAATTWTRGAEAIRAGAEVRCLALIFSRLVEASRSASASGTARRGRTELANRLLDEYVVMSPGEAKKTGELAGADARPEGGQVTASGGRSGESRVAEVSADSMRRKSWWTSREPGAGGELLHPYLSVSNDEYDAAAGPRAQIVPAAVGLPAGALGGAPELVEHRSQPEVRRCTTWGTWWRYD